MLGIVLPSNAHSSRSALRATRYSDQTDTEDEQSEAFEIALICGMGWTEARFSFDEDPDGKYIEEEIDPREISLEPLPSGQMRDFFLGPSDAGANRIIRGKQHSSMRLTPGALSLHRSGRAIRRLQIRCRRR